MTQNFLFKFGLLSVMAAALGIGLWSTGGPSVAVNKSPIPAHKCCSTWEDHMRASGVDDEVGKAFAIRPLLAGVSQTQAVNMPRAVMDH